MTWPVGVVLALIVLLVGAMLPLQEASSGEIAHAGQAVHAATEAPGHGEDSGVSDPSGHSHCSLEVRCQAKGVFVASGASAVSVAMRMRQDFGPAVHSEEVARRVELPPPRA